MTKEQIVEGKLNETYIHKGRRTIRGGWGRKGMRFSWFVWNLYHPDNQIVRGDGCVIHHENEIRLDDSPENLRKMTGGGHSSLHHLGKPLPEEARKKMSLSAIGKYVSEETKGRMSKAHIGISVNLGRKLSEEHKKKISLAGKGAIRSEETRIKMSLAAKKRWGNEQYRIKQIKAQTGRAHTEETKKKISESQRDRHIVTHSKEIKGTFYRVK